MMVHRIEKRCLSIGILLVLTLILISSVFNTDVFASSRDSLLKQSSTTITAPAIILQDGNSSTSTIYMNNTSAAVRVTARGWNVQSGTGSISAGNTYTTVNINSVNLSRSFLLVEFGGGIAGAQPEQDVIVSGKFNSASQLRFDRTGTTNPANFGYYVIEALSTQISVQSGTTQFASAETLKDTNINDVADTSKCVVFLSRRSTGTDRSQYYESFVTGELTNNTNVRLSRQGTGTTVTAEWFVVKFNDDTTIQTGETAVSTSNPTSQNIGSVDLSRSWLYFTWRATANGLAQDSPRGWIQTSTQIQWFRQTTTGTVYARWFVIQMPSGANVQRGLSNSIVSSEYTKDITISPVNLNRTFSFTTCDSSGTGINFPRPFWIEGITNTTNLRLQRWDTGQTSDHNWQVIELPDAYDYVLRASNTGTSSWQIRLNRYSDSGIGRLKNCTIYFRRSSGETSSQIVISNGSLTVQTGPWLSVTNSETIYIAMTVQGNSTGTSNVYTYLEVLTPGTTTFAQYVVAFGIT